MFDMACDEGPGSSGMGRGVEPAVACDPVYVAAGAPIVLFPRDGGAQVLIGQDLIQAECDVFPVNEAALAVEFADATCGRVFCRADLPASADALVDRSAERARARPHGRCLVVFW